MFNIGKDNKENINDILIKYEKRKIHMRYIAAISTGICIWMIAMNASANTEFIAQLSLAGTISSIILSVIAIIMSITGEGKTEAIRNQILETTQELKHTVASVEKIDADVQDSIAKLKGSIEILQEKVDKVPDATAERFSKNSSLQNGYNKNDIRTRSNRNSRSAWIDGGE